MVRPCPKKPVAYRWKVCCVGIEEWLGEDVELNVEVCVWVMLVVLG